MEICNKLIRERTGIYWQAKGRSGRGRRPYTLFTAIFLYYCNDTDVSIINTFLVLQRKCLEFEIRDLKFLKVFFLFTIVDHTCMTCSGYCWIKISGKKYNTYTIWFNSVSTKVALLISVSWLSSLQQRVTNLPFVDV